VGILCLWVVGLVGLVCLSVVVLRFARYGPMVSIHISYSSPL
jgi:hypothetical protein